MTNAETIQLLLQLAGKIVETASEHRIETVQVQPCANGYAIDLKCSGSQRYGVGQLFARSDIDLIKRHPDYRQQVIESMLRSLDCARPTTTPS